MSRFVRAVWSSLFAGLLAFNLAAATGPDRTPAHRAFDGEELAGMRHDGKRIFLRSVVFDPVAERPDFGAVDLEAGESGDYAILQFRAGALERKAAFEKMGVRFFGYVPDNGYQVRIPAALHDAVAGDPAVRWLGAYLPGYKVHPRLLPGSNDPGVGVTIRLFPDADASAIARALNAKYPEARLKQVSDDDQLIRFAIPLAARDAFVRDAARTPEISWVEPHDAMHLHNEQSSGVVQGGSESASGRTIFGHGITGTGQIVAVADTGLDSDMCYFRNLNGVDQVTEGTRTSGPEPGPTFPSRKVFGYWVQPGADAYDTNASCDGDPASYHGSHTSGSVAGDSNQNPSSPSSAGVDPGDGMAPNAQLIMQDLGSEGGCLDGDNGPDMYMQALRGGARVHSNSFGSDTSGAYSSDDQLMDRFLFENDQMTIVFSAGNSGPGAGTTGSPGNSKNVITVGAVGHGASTNVTFFSSRGPTGDGRIKPDIMAPGQNVISAGGNATFGDGNCTRQTLSGTSMAAPTVAGAAALLRQYFDDGFYPSGTKTTGDALHPRATLVKAVLLNGTLAALPNRTFGDAIAGWGRVFLDNNLYFGGDTRKLRVWNLANKDGVKTGQGNTYRVKVNEGQEFRATLVWSDADATPGVATTLVNDLDLTVVTPGGTYLGNNFAADSSSVTGGSADQKNTVEQVRFAAPVTGVYTITVSGTNIPGNGRALTNRQGYALVASAATCGSAVTVAPTGLSALSSAQMGVNLTFVPAAGSTVTQIYRADGAGSDVGEFQYVGSASGSTFLDLRAQGGQTYSYKLRGADDCGEGPISASVTINATGSCDIDPQFAGVANATQDANNCRINLTWPAAKASCALGQSIVYNIYRSTTPGFTPTGSPLATVSGTSYSDSTVISGTTYYYIVRAEDGVSGSTGPHGGNEEENTIEIHATAFGPPGASGTWVDNGGDTNAYLLLETPWQITSTDHQAGTRSYHSGPDSGSYSSLTCGEITTPELQLGANAVLSYWARYNLEYQWDGVVVEISTDGETWTDLPPTTPAGYPDTLAQTTEDPINACGYPATHGAFTGPAQNTGLTPWTEYKTDLASRGGQKVQIRWRLTTDPALAFEGFFLDTISVTNVNLPTACTITAVAPVAAFSYSPGLPEVGDPVQFTDESTNVPTAWLWNFGDAALSTSRNPVHTYAAPGTYTVTLVVTNALGTNSTTRTITVFAEGEGPKRRRSVRH